MTYSKPRQAKSRRRKRPAPLPPPAIWSDHLYVEIDRAEIALFKFILESYDNLAYLSVLDKYRAMVRITFSPDSRKTVRALLQTFRGEFSIRRVLAVPPLCKTMESASNL